MYFISINSNVDTRLLFNSGWISVDKVKNGFEKSKCWKSKSNYISVLLATAFDWELRLHIGLVPLGKLREDFNEKKQFKLWTLSQLDFWPTLPP